MVPRLQHLAVGLSKYLMLLLEIYIYSTPMRLDHPEKVVLELGGEEPGLRTCSNLGRDRSICLGSTRLR